MGNFLERKEIIERLKKAGINRNSAIYYIQKLKPRYEMIGIKRKKYDFDDLLEKIKQKSPQLYDKIIKRLAFKTKNNNENS